MAVDPKPTLWGDKWRTSMKKFYSSYSHSEATATEIKLSGRSGEVKVVDGSWKTQKVIFRLSRFTETEENKILEIFKKNPQFIGNFSSKILTSEILPLIEQSDVRLFPGPGVKFSAMCTCGMQGLCTHIYAAIYGLGKKIDRDPQLLFSQRGLDLSLIAEQCGQAKWQEDLPLVVKSAKLPTFADKFIKVPFEPTTGNENSEYEPANIVDVRSAILYAVAPNSRFNADFVTNYRETLTKIFSQNFERYPDESVDLTRPGQVRYLGSSQWTFGNVPLSYVLDALSVEGPTGMQKADASARLLDCARKTALEILKRGAVYPKLFLVDSKMAQIFWLPLQSIPEVKNAIAQLQKKLPAKFVRSMLESPKEMTKNSAEMLVIAILSSYMRVEKDKRFCDDRLYAFFRGITLDSNGILRDGELEKWLAGYEISNASYLPVINGVDAGFGKVDVDLDFIEQETGEVNPYSKLWTRNFPSEKRNQVLLSTQPLQQYLPDYDAYVSGKATDNIHLYESSLIRFLNESVPLFRALGVAMNLPAGIEHVIRGIPQPQIVRSEEKMQAGFARLENLLQMNWILQVGDKIIGGKEFLEMYKESKNLLYLDGQYFYVLESDAKRIQDGLRDRFKMPAFKVLQIALAGEFEGLTVDIAPEALEEIHKLKAENECDVPVPPQIQAELRPYQKRGFAWMLGNAKLGFGSVIADDMGLGKTLQVITLLQQMKNDGAFDEMKALVIVPTGLLQNWKRETAKFAPQIRVKIYHGANRQLELSTVDVIITTYGVFRSDKEELSKIRWQLAVIDEAQNIKNAGTSQSRAVRALSARVKIAMSGTPVENRLLEFWSIMDFCNRGFLGSAKSFHTEFEFPIQERNNKHRAELFKKITAPFLLRRVKTDKNIIADLPEKLEQDEWATLSPEQEKLYQATFNSYMTNIENFELENPEEKFERSAEVLKLIIALKQICNHPAQYLKDGNFDTSLSGKMELFLDIVEAILDTDEKVLVFTQFTEMGEILQKVLKKKLKTEALFYHGALSVSAREKVIAEFESLLEKRILILSLKAGGTGLNLTCASQVIHYDLWWNPAVEAQATDRAYRIGQNRRVVVHRLITKDTFEEKINAIIESKKKISEMTVATGESWITKLSDDELRQIFTIS